MTVAEIADGVKSWRHKPTKVRAARIEADSLKQLADWCGGRVAYSWLRPWRRHLMVPTLHGPRSGHVGWWLIERHHPHEFYPVHPEVFMNEYTAETNGD